MLTINMVSMLCCPVCRKGDLRVEVKEQEKNKIQEGNLVCDTCDISYPVHYGIPDFIPHSKLTGGEWQMWKDHLEGFQARREKRISESTRLVYQLAKRSKKKSKQGQKKRSNRFCNFVGIREGDILDVGCGPGKFRYNFDETKVNYYGIDPIPLPEVEGFRYVRALAEYIPFKDNTFSHILVLAALDHFRDLNSFFMETFRVLKPNGKLHIAQGLHEIASPIALVKMLALSVKDYLESRVTKISGKEVPKHMAEFSKSSLFEILRNYFEILSEDESSHRWYTPKKLFVSLRPKLE